MLKIDKKTRVAIWEASKEPLRLLAIALIPVLLVSLNRISAEWAGALILFFRFVDKLLHLIGKARKDPNMAAGLVRF